MNVATPAAANAAPSTGIDMRRHVLLGACQRMLAFSIVSVPTFLVVAFLLTDHASALGIRQWLVASLLVSLVSGSTIAVRWRGLALLEADLVRQSIVWLFGLPLVLQWGSASLVMAPSDEMGGVIMALIVLVTSTGVFASVGAAGWVLSLGLVGGILIPNALALAASHGAASAPTLLLLYGTGLAFVVGVVARHETSARQRIMVDVENRFDVVSTERAILSELNDELQFRATHDLLMGIPNRELLRSELDAALESQQGADRARVGLLFLDLDRFKYVNDTLGHQAGDALLVAVGGRVQAALVDENALVARVGGDELVVLMRCLESDDHLGLVADKLLTKFVDPFTIDGVELSIGSSIGMAASVLGESADDLYRHADAALYEAKQRGRGRAVLADDALRNRRSSRIRTELALREALDGGEVEAWLQPEVDLISGEVVAAEALARWRMGDEVAHAGSFIDVAERAGLLEQLMFEMVGQVAHWRTRTASSIPVGINVSSTNLEALLAAHRHDPRAWPLQGLRLEISETDIIRDFRGTHSSLQRARELGVMVVLDDFGTGFSSLRMLSDLPIDGIKIDRSYVTRIEHDVRVRRLISSLTEFGRGCGMLVIAEGVETPAQAELLMQLGIDRGQGNLYSAAIEPGEFHPLIERGCGELVLGRHF
ncbi:MAG: EAL domain-containing protein [Actinomycetota bacterium]